MSNKQDDNKYIDAKRRGFMQSSLLVTGAAAAAATATAEAGVEMLETEVVPKPLKPAGYRETEMVREYYRKARF